MEATLESVKQISLKYMWSDGFKEENWECHFLEEESSLTHEQPDTFNNSLCKLMFRNNKTTQWQLRLYYQAQVTIGTMQAAPPPCIFPVCTNSSYPVVTKIN